MPSLSRRQLLLGGSAVGVAAAAGGFTGGAATGWDWFGSDESAAAGHFGAKMHEFVTRPDLRPPQVKVLTRAAGVTDGYVLLTASPTAPATAHGSLPDGLQAGPLIIDNRGEPVWFAPQSTMHIGDYSGLTANLRQQRYQGKPVLTYWRGDYKIPPGFGRGEYAIVDESYREIKVVRAGNGLHGDVHEFVITESDTALMTIYNKAETDSGPVWEGVIQELDIATGEVLFEWHSADHVPPEESMSPAPSPGGRFPYFHINSVTKDGDDALLISARNTSTIYRIDRHSGEILWRLGGKRSDFDMRTGTTFKWQHHARRQPDGTLTLFDNASPPETSRALKLELDEQNMVARLRKEYSRPKGASSASQGDAQFQDGGNVLVGWGSEPYVTEFTAAGNVLLDAYLGDNIESYRAFRADWTGQPDEAPAVAARDEDDALAVYASWNGATEVAGWRVLGGDDPGRLNKVTEAARAGFETRTEVDTAASYVAVAGLDINGNVLGTSKAIQTSG